MILMKSKSSFFILLLLSFMAAILLLGALKTSEAKTITVDDDGGADHLLIQNAVDNASAGDIIQVSEGIYNESVTVNTTMTIQGKGSGKCLINGGGEGNVVTISAEWVNLSGFSITGSGTSLTYAGLLIDSGHCHISDVNSSSNQNGVCLAGGNTTLEGSIFNDNVRGAFLCSGNNTMSGCEFSGNSNGIYLSGNQPDQEPFNNIVRDSDFRAGNYGLFIMTAEHLYLFNNTIQETTRHGVYLITSSQVILKDNLIRGASMGIALASGRDVRIRENTITGCESGILVTGISEDVILRQNLIHGNIDLGIDADLNHGEAVDARYNWWGSEFGPLHTEAGWNGRGDNVSGLVDYDPWMGKTLIVKYVDDDAPEGGNGSEEAPYRKIQDGVDTVQEGGIVYVLNGTYRENLVVNKTLYLMGNGSANTIINAKGFGNVVELRADQVNMSGFWCTGSGNGPDNAGILIVSNSNDLSDIISNKNGGNGMRILKGERNRFRDSVFSFNSESGVFIDSTCQNDFKRVDSVSNGASGFHLTSSTDNRITWGNCSGNTNGFTFDSSSDDNTILFCEISSNADDGIFLEASLANLLSDNRITKNRNGITLTDSSKHNMVRYSFIFNNTDNGIDAQENHVAMETRLNWWGSETGPHHPLENPDGKGDNVTDNVKLDTWLEKELGQIWYVAPPPQEGSDGSLEKPFDNIQNAVDNATNGDIIRVMEGTFRMRDGVFVDKTLDIVGSGYPQTTITGVERHPDHQHYFYVSADNCTITGFRFWGWAYFHEFGAIGLYNSDGHKIMENRFDYNNVGVYFAQSSHNRIFNNSFHKSQWNIRFSGGSRNEYNIYENNVFNGTLNYATYMEGAHHLVTGNTFISGEGLYVSGNNITVTHNAFLKNVYDQPPGRWQQNYSGIRMAGENNRLSYNTFIGNDVGIKIWNSSGTIITNNIITGNKQGIQFIGADSDQMIRYNKIWNNSEYGVNASMVDPGPANFSHNWWGDDSGPYHPENNSQGKGNNVTDNVFFDPRYTRPVAMIDSISPNPAILEETDEIIFTGGGGGMGGLVCYSWRSDLDGELYNGTESVFKVGFLSSGLHTIYFRVCDDLGKWSVEDSMDLAITRRPEASISLLATFAFAGEDTYLNGTALDDGELGRWVWNSSIDGLLSDDSKANISTQLSAGEHIISLKVMDEYGAWSKEETVSLDVYVRPGAEIVSIYPGIVILGETIHFSGSGTDMETIEEFSWSSDLDGYLGGGAVFNSSTLSPGNHTITLKIRHSYGGWSQEDIAGVHVHERPVAWLDEVPAERALEGDRLTFTGHGTDDEQVAAHRWSSSIDGHLSYLPSFSTTQLSPGEHIISFAVRDDHDIWSKQVNTSVFVKNTIHAVVVSATPVYSQEDETLLFIGDGDDEILRYVWRSSLAGEFYNGTLARIEYNALLPGNHTIYLKVMDHLGTWSKAVETQIFINGIPRASIVSVSPDPALITDVVHFTGNVRDDGEILEYRWHSSIDGLLYQGEETGFHRTSLSAGQHLISLEAMDDHAVWSSKAETTLLVRAAPPLNQRPEVSMKVPVNSSALSGEVFLGGSALDHDGAVLQVEISINNGLWQPVTGTTNWSFIWNTSRLEDGSHNIAVRAFDGEKYSELSQRVVNVENSADEPGPVAPEEEEEARDSLVSVTLPILGAALALAFICLALLARLPSRFFDSKGPGKD